MKSYVLTDESLGRQAGQFVWLAIDTEKPENAAVRAQFPIVALPTYFIVDPADETPVLRWVGGASIEQLHALLDEGREAVGRAMLARDRDDREADPEEGAANGALVEADRALANADLLYGQGKDAEAASAYEAALAIAPDHWSSYARTVESLLFAYDRSSQPERAAKLALDVYPMLAGNTSAANVAASGLSGAVELPKDHALRAAWIETLEGYVREVLANPSPDLAADELSGVYIALYNAREDAGDDAGRLEVARAWASHLERAAEAATSPDQRTVYDSHRLSAYLELGQPQRAIAMLEQSRDDFPDDYNPEARLAVAYREMKQFDKAIEASTQALAKSYGPRKLRIFYNHAGICAMSGDTTSAIRVLEDGLRHAEALPEPQRSKTWTERLKKRHATLQ